MDRDDERFVEQATRAMELGAILEDLGLAADGGYERLLVNQCVFYGNSDDDLGGARFVRQLIDEAEDDLQRVGLVRGLLLTGDPRIELLVGGVWRLLGFGNQQRLAGSLGGAANPLTAAFLGDWLQSAEGAEYVFVQAALSEVTQVLKQEETP